jgi:hypothetical protein
MFFISGTYKALQRLSPGHLLTISRAVKEAVSCYTKPLHWHKLRQQENLIPKKQNLPREI